MLDSILTPGTGAEMSDESRHIHFFSVQPLAEPAFDFDLRQTRRQGSNHHISGGIEHPTSHQDALRAGMRQQQLSHSIGDFFGCVIHSGFEPQVVICLRQVSEPGFVYNPYRNPASAGCGRLSSAFLSANHGPTRAWKESDLRG